MEIILFLSPQKHWRPRHGWLDFYIESFKSKNLFVAASTLFDEKGREIGFGTGDFAKSNIGLSEDTGCKL